MIRSLTIGVPLGDQSPDLIGGTLERLVDVATGIAAESGIGIRTIRLTLPPCGPAFELEGGLSARVALADSLASRASARWICLPVDYVSTGSTQIRSAEVLSVIARYPKVFVNYMLAGDGVIALGAAARAARDVVRVSKLSNNGFDNFRVGASFNCPANAPFFPFSRHEGPDVAFSFALETVPLAMAAVRRHPRDLAAAADAFSSHLSESLAEVEQLARRIETDTGVEFRGTDASLAPLPGRDSVADVVSTAMGCPVGGPGTLLATAMLTDAIRQAFRKSSALPVGFNGVMYSVLEDEGLAAAVSRRTVTLDSLLSYASVCGCGIDMVPLPGSTFPEEIAACMSDVAGLSTVLNKPLGLRVLPVPGNGVGDFTQFNQDFLCDSRVIALPGECHRPPSPDSRVSLGTTIGSLRRGEEWR